MSYVPEESVMRRSGVVGSVLAAVTVAVTAVAVAAAMGRITTRLR